MLVLKIAVQQQEAIALKPLCFEKIT
jgi:hypothetical protein